MEPILLQSGMNSGQSGMNSDHGGMNSDQGGMNSNHSGMNSGQSGMNSDHSGMNSDQGGMNSNHSGMKSGQSWTSSFFNWPTGNQKNGRRKRGDVGISPYEELYNELLDTHSSLEKENTRLKKENNVLWNQSAEVFKQNRDKRLELVNDPYPLSTIVDDMRHLYTEDWFNIWEEDGDDCSTIQQISDMLKAINRKCRQRADQQIRSLLCLDDEQPVPTRQEKPDIYRLRRKEGIDPDVRERVTTKIVSELLEDPSQSYAEGTKEEYEVRNFFRKFADFCWLLAIAEERVIVVFNVVGKDYQKIKRYFDKYHMTNHKVTGTKPNSVKTLVWPCITKEDGTLLEKGHVIVVENS